MNMPPNTLLTDLRDLILEYGSYKEQSTDGRGLRDKCYADAARESLDEIDAKLAEIRYELDALTPPEPAPARVRHAQPEVVEGAE